ncbi:MAG: flagellar hook-basal body complex protein FliE [Undibacterium sp.]|nr:flagellar hook-basal body complex protein FliE [Opitutaceae bacterium]
MSPLGSVNPLSAAPPLTRIDAPLPKLGLNAPGAATATHTDGFGQVFDNLVSSVTARENASSAMTRKVLLGETDQLHQSVIARQEASVSFSLMVEVRNKLVESYQELMRMQA